MRHPPSAVVSVCRLHAAVFAVALATGGMAAADPVARAGSGGAVAPAAWLRTQSRPLFRDGHTLPPLTRWGWALDHETRLEFAEHWGYCVELTSAVTKSYVDGLRKDPRGADARLVSLAAKDPRRFKLQVLTSRALPDGATVPTETWAHNAAGMLLNGQAKSLDGMVWTPGMAPIFSPEAPDTVWKASGQLQAEPLAQLRKLAPIAVILNGGEYGLAVPGWGQKAWEQDPAIVRAKGKSTWADYGSKQLANSQRIIADQIKKAVPDRELYVYYTAGGVPYRNSYSGWKDWGPCFEDMNGVTDLPNSVAYYKEYNSGWTWGERGDLLTQSLNARGQEIAGGKPLAYNWLCGGYKPEPGMISDIGLYAGFLKMYYTAGMIGGNAGYYEYPVTNGVRGFEAPFSPDAPPPWIQQMVVLARVHAMFSFFEEYLREGDLLPGPNRHRWSKDQPAYEFPTGDENARVVARRLRGKKQWLITAWAADGVERRINVDIPELGVVTLLARGCATVHKAKVHEGKPAVKIFDSGDAYWLAGVETPPPALSTPSK